MMVKFSLQSPGLKKRLALRCARELLLGPKENYFGCSDGALLFVW